MKVALNPQKAFQAQQSHLLKVVMQQQQKQTLLIMQQQRQQTEALMGILQRKMIK